MMAEFIGLLFFGLIVYGIYYHIKKAKAPRNGTGTGAGTNQDSEVK